MRLFNIFTDRRSLLMQPMKSLALVLASFCITVSSLASVPGSQVETADYELSCGYTYTNLTTDQSSELIEFRIPVPVSDQAVIVRLTDAPHSIAFVVYKAEGEEWIMAFEQVFADESTSLISAGSLYLDEQLHRVAFSDNAWLYQAGCIAVL